MIERVAITGVILCGGEGRRLGGRDKPLEIVAGKSLVAHVRGRLLPQVGSILISCNRNTEAYGAWGDTVVTDTPTPIGPLGGILSALEAVETPYAFICPGDAPLLSSSLVLRLANALSLSGADLSVPHDGERMQHLFMLVRADARARLQDFIDASGRSVRTWIDDMHAIVIDASHEHSSFLNVNAEEDLVRVARLLG